MNNQEIFNIVWNGLKSQGFEQSMMNHYLWGETCAYRGDNGCKCAAGWLIPDEEYDFRREGSGIADYPWFKDNFDHNELHIIGELQIIHDRCDVPKVLEKQLIDFAKQNDLTIPE